MVVGMAPQWRSISIVALMFLLGGIGIISGLRGLNTGVQVWGVYNWWVTYDHGFIKRALIGTIFQWFVDDANVETSLKLIVIQHYIMAGLLLIGLLAVAYRMMVHSDHWFQIACIWLVFFSCQFLPTAAYNTGYLDIHLWLIFGLALWAMWRRLYWLAMLAGVIGPLVHESYVFLWLGAIVLAVWRYWIGRRDFGFVAATVLCPIFVTLIIVAFHSPSAVAAELARAPIDAEMRDFLLAVQFGQTMPSAFLYMMTLYRQHPENSLIGAVYFLIPTIVIIMAAAASWRCHAHRRSAIVALMFASLAPLSILLFAWDYSRFLVVSSFVAMLAFTLVSEYAPGDETNETSYIAC